MIGLDKEIGLRTLPAPDQSTVPHDKEILSQIENFAQFVPDKHDAERFPGAPAEVLHQLLGAGRVNRRRRLVQYGDL